MFIAHLIQDGEGCDYMIGCGETVTVLPEEIKTMEEAEVYVAKRYAGWFGSPFGECQECEEDCEECDFELDEDWDRFNDERSFADVIIYEVSDSKSPDIESFKAANRAKAEAMLEKSKEAKELAELKRLQEKHKGKV